MNPPRYLAAIILCLSALGLAHADEKASKEARANEQLATEFTNVVKPVLKKTCYQCHGEDLQESGVRIDVLNGGLDDKQLFLLKRVVHQLNDGVMPPEDELQPSKTDKAAVIDWINRALDVGQRQIRPKNGTARRLTVSQYQNTLRDLLGVEDQLARVLPADGVSEEGFRNNTDTLLLTPQMMETYFAIAEQALDICLVDETTKPKIQCFRVEFGSGVNKEPPPEKIQLNGPRLLPKGDYFIHEVEPDKPFEYERHAMRKSFRFIEGYIGNGTIREWRDFKGLHHSVFAAVIGQNTGGFNYGRASHMVPSGLLMRPRSPETSRNGRAASRGAAPTLSMPIRELPRSGVLQVTVEAARYDDGFQPSEPAPASEDRIDLEINGGQPATFTLQTTAVYQIDVAMEGAPTDDVMTVDIDGRTFSKRMKGKFEPDSNGEVVIPLLVARLGASEEMSIKVGNGDGKNLRRARLTRVSTSTEAGAAFAAFEKRAPYVGVQMGVRTDVGARLARFADPKPVPSASVERYAFRAPISSFAAQAETDNVNYLSGLREIAVRSEPTDDRQMPRVLVHAMEVEGPYFEQWPPRGHREIFIPSANKNDHEVYAVEVLQRFATRAFRRPPVESELDSLFRVWEESYDETGNFQLSIRNALLVALTSPQFLLVTEESEGPHAEPLSSFELAAKLSYFLWDTTPDAKLHSLAARGQLQKNLTGEVDRMVNDDRFLQFADEFVSQWLSLDKFDVVNVNHGKFPELNRETRRELRKEPIQFVAHLIRENLPVRNLVDCDFVVANEVVAGYYGIGRRADQGYRFLPVQHKKENLGGVLSQAAVLAGLSDGSESNPVKRGAWLARKIVAEPPDPPPPNVPELSDEKEAGTLRERLEQHRDQKGCMKCHEKIDPWGLPLEEFDAGGLFKRKSVEASSTLPDKTEIANAAELKRYLAEDRIDQVAYSFLMHLASYATGRSLSFNEREYLRVEGPIKLKKNGYRMRDCVAFVAESPIFMEK